MQEETCPFCGVSVVPASLDGTSSSFIPPYAPHLAKNSDIPPSPYGPWDEDHKEEPVEGSSKKSGGPDPSTDEFKKVLVAVSFLLTGSVFFLFGLALVLFSTEGTLALRWDGAFWYFYMLSSLPLLYFGWKFMMKLD